MSRSIVFRRVAKSELDDAVAWYENKEEGLGIKFYRAIAGQLERVATSPEQFACVRGQVRPSCAATLSVFDLLFE